MPNVTPKHWVTNQPPAWSPRHLKPKPSWRCAVRRRAVTSSHVPRSWHFLTYTLSKVLLPVVHKAIGLLLCCIVVLLLAFSLGLVTDNFYLCEPSLFLPYLL